MRKQAAELRFIAEAPKLEIGADERVSIPSVTGDDYRRDTSPHKDFLIKLF